MVAAEFDNSDGSENDMADGEANEGKHDDVTCRLGGKTAETDRPAAYAPAMSGRAIEWSDLVAGVVDRYRMGSRASTASSREVDLAGANPLGGGGGQTHQVIAFHRALALARIGAAQETSPSLTHLMASSAEPVSKAGSDRDPCAATANGETLFVAPTGDSSNTKGPSGDGLDPKGPPMPMPVPGVACLATPLPPTNHMKGSEMATGAGAADAGMVGGKEGGKLMEDFGVTSGVTSAATGASGAAAAAAGIVGGPAEGAIDGGRVGRKRRRRRLTPRPPRKDRPEITHEAVGVDGVWVRWTKSGEVHFVSSEQLAASPQGWSAVEARWKKRRRISNQL
jgi:hypothetical protein